MRARQPRLPRTTRLARNAFPRNPLGSFVGENYPAIGIHFAAHRGPWRLPKRRVASRSGLEISMSYFLHVLLRLAIPRHSPGLIHCAFARVVCRECLGQVAVVSIEEPSEIRCATFHVLCRIHRIADAKSFRRFWN